MAEQQRKSKSTGERTADETDVAADDVEATTEAGDKLKGELDDLLDEIDEVLETNAEDFVKSYVQKGGE